MAPVMKRPASEATAQAAKKQATTDAAAKTKLPELPIVVPGRVPVYVMLQLDWLTADGLGLSEEVGLEKQLRLLKQAGVRGVMADVWWGLCEPQPKTYHFDGVVRLCSVLRTVGLKLQAVMSFHQCGGNVGDAVSIPLPKWALEPARTQGLLYRSCSGVVSEDCLSLSADRERIFPSAAGGFRTALDCYRDYIAAFVTAVGDHAGTTVDEIQVGMGPCGELRYPSYMLSNGWQYPGVGLVMAHDAGMLRMLQEGTQLREPPAGLPTEQNGAPDDCALFRVGSDPDAAGFRCGDGRTFLEWYSRTLVSHGHDVLLAAAEGLRQAGTNPPAQSLAFSVKVSGLHWHVMHPSRATEACAGYNNCTSPEADAYQDIARMISQAAKTVGRPVFFNFTCLEMNNWDGASSPNTRSAPEDLIAQVRQACVKHQVPLSGENALEFDVANGGALFEQIRKQLRGWSPGTDRMHGVTLLRLNDHFVSKESLAELGKFVSDT